MAFLDLAHSIVLHRETYTATLKGILHYGSGRDFADDIIGITPNYLSNLRNPDHDPPSPAMAYRITQALPLEPERRQALLEHMLLAHEGRQELIQQLTPLWREPLLSTLLPELYAANDAANRSDTSSQTAWYRVVVEAGQAMLRHFDPARNLLDYVQVCLIVQDAASVLNQREDALYTAKLATVLLDSSNPSDYEHQRDRYNYLRINSWYAQNVAYRNLDLPRQSYDSNLGAAHLITSEAREQTDFWMPHLLRDELAALSRRPRFSLSDADALADEVRRRCETRTAPDTESLLSLLDKTLIEAYLAYNSPRSIQKALKTLERLQPDRSLNLSPIKRAVILAVAAKTYHTAGDLDASMSYLQQWIAISKQAGLTHQLAKARAQFGAVVDYFISSS